MDEELKAIQADLDSVLDRLAAYMVSGRPRADQGEPDVAAREGAAQVVLLYAGANHPNNHPANLNEAITQLRDAQSWNRFREKGFLEDHGEQPGRLLAALEALVDWKLKNRLLEYHHLQELAESAVDLRHGATEYFGQNVGLPMVPKRKVDRRLYDRLKAATLVLDLHNQDPVANPVGEALFERVGKQVGMSASVVKRAYYSAPMRHYRAALAGHFLDWSDFE